MRRARNRRSQHKWREQRLRRVILRATNVAHHQNQADRIARTSSVPGISRRTRRPQGLAISPRAHAQANVRPAPNACTRTSFPPMPGTSQSWRRIEYGFRNNMRKRGRHTSCAPGGSLRRASPLLFQMVLASHFFRTGAIAPVPELSSLERIGAWTSSCPRAGVLFRALIAIGLSVCFFYKACTPIGCLPRRISIRRAAWLMSYK